MSDEILKARTKFGILVAVGANGPEPLAVSTDLGQLKADARVLYANPPPGVVRVLVLTSRTGTIFDKKVRGLSVISEEVEVEPEIVVEPPKGKGK
jgi:hypothetical protein